MASMRAVMMGSVRIGPSEVSDSDKAISLLGNEALSRMARKWLAK